MATPNLTQPLILNYRYHYSFIRALCVCRDGRSARKSVSRFMLRYWKREVDNIYLYSEQISNQSSAQTKWWHFS